MIDFGKWAFDNKKLVYFLVAVLFVGGLYSAYDMSKLEDPEIKVKMAMVIATRPGASAHEMEMEITEPLEKNIRTIGEIDCVTSWSYNDLTILQVEVKSIIPDKDIEQCWDMLRRKVSDTESGLPEGSSVSVQDDIITVIGSVLLLGVADGSMQRVSLATFILAMGMLMAKKRTEAAEQQYLASRYERRSTKATRKEMPQALGRASSADGEELLPRTGRNFFRGRGETSSADGGELLPAD